MLNALFDINWNNIQYVGFDLDGTLYDEYDFIHQAYNRIDKQLLKDPHSLDFMLHIWLSKGSSYTRLFNDTYINFEYKYHTSEQEFVNKALLILRNTSPKLTLNIRCQYLLNFLSKKYTLFLISDGYYIVQNKKFIALNLSRFFKKNNVFFTNQYGYNFTKPSTDILSLLENINISRSVFFGDREVDEYFAKNAGMKFQRVYSMTVMH